MMPEGAEPYSEDSWARRQNIADSGLVTLIPALESLVTS